MTQRWILALVLLCIPAAQLAAQGGAEPEPEGDPILREAVALIDADRMDEAMRALERLRTAENPSAVGLALLGGLYVESGRPLDALDVLEPLSALDPPDPAVLYNAGRAALALGQMQRAGEFFDRSIQVDPSSPARRELGLMLGRGGMYTRALALLKPWATQYPTDIEVRLAAAFCAVQLERVPDAEELLSDLPQSQPQVSLLWSRLLLIKGDPWGAVNTLTAILESAPETMQLDVRRVLADAYAAVGQAAQAVEVLAGYSERDPSIALQVGLAQYQSGDLDAALETLRPFAEGLAGSPDPALPATLAADLALHYGRFLAMAGERERALPYLEQATSMDPDDKQGWQILGQTLAALGRRDEAKLALERFQEISKREVSASKQEQQEQEERDDPTLAAVRETFALMAEERLDEALARIRQERAIARNDLRPVLLEGRLLTLLGRNPEALEVAEQAVRAAPDNADSLYLRGTVHMAMGNAPAAEADFRQALTLRPEHTATMNDLAVLLIDSGDTAEARALLERALELNPDDEVAAENLANIEG